MSVSESTGHDESTRIRMCSWYSVHEYPCGIYLTADNARKVASILNSMADSIDPPPPAGEKGGG
jgi:hypothetical protein